MTYGAAVVDGNVVYYEIRNDCGMYCGSAIENQSPFDECKAITMEDAENNARLWAAAPDMLAVLEEINNYLHQKTKSKLAKRLEALTASVIAKAQGINP